MDCPDHLNLVHDNAHADDDTVAVMMELHRNDIAEIRRLAKGKQKESEPNDTELAVQLFLMELNHFETSREDARIAQSIGTAVIEDAPILNNLISQEVQAQNDHEMALQLQDGGSEGLSARPEQQTDIDKLKESNSDMDLKLLAAKFADLHGLRRPPWDITADIPIAESSRWAVSRKPENLQASGHCVACGDDKAWFDLDAAPCAHEYCSDCLSELFHSAMTDESLYPPRCCGQPILFQRVQPFIAPEVSEAFSEKQVELDARDRTYCFKAHCSTFIPPDRIEDEVGECPSCSGMTCVVCKESAHQGDCPKDFPLQVLLDTANEQGWQRCYSCRRLVDLVQGCNHIT